MDDGREELALNIKYLELNLLDNAGHICATKVARNIIIQAGDFVLITGNNGSGKSTLNNALFGLIPIDSKSQWWSIGAKSEGYITGVPELKDKNIFCLDNELDKKNLKLLLCNVQQQDYFIDYKSVHYSLSKPSEILISERVRQAKSHKEGRAQKKELLDRLHRKLGEYESLLDSIYHSHNEKNNKIRYKMPRELSGGQQKFVSILSKLLRAEIGVCPFIFMDEPLNNLDVNTKRLLNDIISRIRQNNKNLIIFVVTHCRIFDGVSVELHIGDSEITMNRDNFQPFRCLDGD